MKKTKSILTVVLSMCLLFSVNLAKTNAIESERTLLESLVDNTINEKYLLVESSELVTYTDENSFYYYYLNVSDSFAEACHAEGDIYHYYVKITTVDGGNNKISKYEFTSDDKFTYSNREFFKCVKTGEIEEYEEQETQYYFKVRVNGTVHFFYFNKNSGLLDKYQNNRKDLFAVSYDKQDVVELYNKY